MNASKRGIAVDRMVADGAELIRRLAAVADIVIENFRPGVLDRADLGYDALASTNPGLVMLSISGFGRTGPESQRQAYAPVVHAESGLVARQASLDGRTPTDLALALADSLAALHGTVAILAALLLRSRTGAGQHIDLSMLDAMVATDDYTHNAIDEVYDIYPPRGDMWPAAGGPIMVAADPKTMWVRMTKHTGMPDPAPDADLATKIAARSTAIAAWIASFDDRAALMEELVAADLPWADVRTTETILESPSLIDREVLAQVDDGEGGQRGVVRMPYRFSAADCDVRGAAPTPGRDSDAVLRDWLHLPAEDIASLRSSGALG
jgi:CoA:oxalate CoA-transferase